MKISKLFVISALLLVLGGVQQAQAQLFRTNLDITVLDENGNVQRGAVVKLYSNETDYTEDKGAISTEKTDEKGRARFKKLDAKSYFIRAQKGDLNNDDTSFQTAALTENKLNKVNIIISGFEVPR